MYAVYMHGLGEFWASGSGWTSSFCMHYGDDMWNVRFVTVEWGLWGFRVVVLRFPPKRVVWLRLHYGKKPFWAL